MEMHSGGQTKVKGRKKRVDACMKNHTCIRGLKKERVDACMKDHTCILGSKKRKSRCRHERYSEVKLGGVSPLSKKIWLWGGFKVGLDSEC